MLSIEGVRMSLPLIPLGLLGRTGTTGYPVLRSTSNHVPTTFNTTHTVNLPAGIEAGDLVILSLNARATILGLSALNLPSGWTSLAYDTSVNTSFVRSIAIIATGSMSTVTINTPGASTSITSNGYCFSSYSLFPSCSSYATGTSANPNSPSLATPVLWGGDPHKLCISVMHLKGNVTASAIPSGYGDQISSLSSNDNRTYSARREVQSSGDEDPSSWTIEGTNPGTQEWRAATIAVRGPE